MGCFSMYELLRTGQKLHFWFSKLVPETVTDLQTICDCACAGMWPIRVVYGADGPVLSTTDREATLQYHSERCRPLSPGEVYYINKPQSNCRPTLQ